MSEVMKKKPIALQIAKFSWGDKIRSKDRARAARHGKNFFSKGPIFLLRGAKRFWTNYQLIRLIHHCTCSLWHTFNLI
ncbi:UNVERIFIED_CONTAM: hypothetical protein ACS92_05595 [Bacillus cereus]